MRAALSVPVQVMEFYCEPCETAMCRECTEGEHREHVTVPLRDVVEQHKAALQQQLDAVRSRYGAKGAGGRQESSGGPLHQCPPSDRLLRRLPQLAAAIGLVSEISQQLVERKNEAVSEIGSTFEELETALRQRKGLLVRDLEATCGAKQKVTPPTPLCPGTIVPLCRHPSPVPPARLS